MITVNDKTLDECIQFLENCEGKCAKRGSSTGLLRSDLFRF